MRVATYNIHDCIGMDKRFDPARTATVLTELDVDVIALQEVTLDLAGKLAGHFETATGMHAIDGTLFERGVGRYGNLLLLHEKPVATELHDVSCPGREPRGIVEATLQTQDGPLRILATHLGLSGRERGTQIGRIAELLEASQAATVLLGDLNIWGWSRLLRRLSSAGFQHVPVRSFPTRPHPLLPIDRILARTPARLLHSWRHDSATARLASDHFPVVAELGLTP